MVLPMAGVIQKGWLKAVRKATALRKVLEKALHWV